jgi:hypothetical protein
MKPINIVVLQQHRKFFHKSDGLSAIKKEVRRRYPNEHYCYKIFWKSKEEDFTQYGSSAKKSLFVALEDL